MGKFFQELRRRNVVRVVGAYLIVGWVLMQIATALEESLNLPEWFDGVVVSLLIVGLPVAIIVSWVFDLTADGVVRTEDSPGGSTNRKLNYVIGAALIVAGAVFAWQSFDSSEPEVIVAAPPPVVVDEIDAATIAVLPFADLSPAGDQEYFSDGISEEILNLLASVRALDVTSRTSAFQFKGRDLGIPEIAANLKVRHVVEGSVRKAGNTLRITAQLIDARDDRHLWSDTFDRPLTAENVFAIQDEISKAIVAALGDTLGFNAETSAIAMPNTDSLTAYELFLRARPIVQARNNLTEADHLLRQAVEQDPEFAKAWELLAAVQFLMWDYGETDLSREEANRLTIEFADKAIALEPASSTAIASKVHIVAKDPQFLDSGTNWSHIIADYTRALEIDPRNDSALNWRGLGHQQLGYLDAAITDFSNCTRYEPLNVPCNENLAYTLTNVGRDTEAFDVITRGLNQGIVKLEYVNLPLLARLEKEELFKAASNSRRSLFGWREHDELYEAMRNLNREYPKLIESLRQFHTQNPDRDAYALSDIRTVLGDFDLGNAGFSYWGVENRRYRQSDQFKNLIQSIGILSHWQEHGFPPQCRAIGEDDFACD